MRKDASIWVCGEREREREFELEFLSSIKRPMGPQCTCVLDMCLLPKKGYLYIEAQSLDV